MHSYLSTGHDIGPTSNFFGNFFLFFMCVLLVLHGSSQSHIVCFYLTPHSSGHEYKQVNITTFLTFPIWGVGEGCPK